MNLADQVAIAGNPGLLDWLLHGERGISSQTVVSVLTGCTVDSYQSEPYDPSDFRRCELLLRSVPTLRSRLHQMRDVSPWWAYLVDNWQQIVDLMEDEVSGCFTPRPGSGDARKAYALIKAGQP